ncbi:MAG: hypothetical protein H7Y33_05425, partial [Cytophagales bacterium]|nr:hypothetical protein [Rhizobacter sp.]
MLKFTSSYTKSPERILEKRQDGEDTGPTKGDGYRYSTSGEISFNEAARGISDLGEIVYAILVADGIVKIGWT